MSYKIQFLDDNSFDRLPYKGVHTSLGLADSNTRTAYVRRTGINAVDLFTAAHELEHLEEGRQGVHAGHEHYGDGVYYKDLMEIFTGPKPQPQAPMQQSFSPQPQQAPQVQAAQSPVSQPNVSQPGSGMGGSPSGGLPGGDTIQKLKGFFSGRSPQGGM